MVDKPFEAIPGVPESEIGEAVQSLTKIPAISLGDHERFLISVRSLVESRARSGWQNEGSADVGVFLLAPYPRQLGERFGALPLNNLIATSDAILGKMFFLNRDASSGRSMDLPVSSNQVLEWLDDQKLGHLPVVMAHRNKKLLISRVRGAAGDMRKDIIRDKPPEVTLDELLEALTLSHHEILLTPGGVCPKGIWERGRSAEYVPGVSPEKVIQQELLIFLTSWFHGVVKVGKEDSVNVGRIDIRLLRQVESGGFAYWVVLELKVLRSSHNAKKPHKPTAVTSADNADVVAEGVRQAFAFGKEMKAEPSLEIYDLRKDKSDNILTHDAVLKELQKCSPALVCRVWPLFGSASDARIASISL